MKNAKAHRFEWIVIGTCAFLALLTMVLNAFSPVANSLRRGERITGLLVGADYEDYARHSDTMMLVSFDPQSRFLDVMSIPRDTMISLPQYPHVRRINEVFTYEFRHTGKNWTMASLALKSVVETFLSSGTVRPITIPYFFTIDYRGFRNLIDALGGVSVRVTEPMHYDDNWGKLHIHFEPGTYLLDGQKALEYVRFRGGSADQGRQLRQQLFVKEVVKRLKNPSTLWRFPRYAKTVLAGFHTNFTLWDLFSIAMEARRMKFTNMRLFTLPGTTSGNYWKMNPENTQNTLALMTAPVQRQLPSRSARAKAANELRGATVEVWNASSRPNAARSVMQLLRENGFDVVLFGNFATRQQRTLVIDRSGRLRPAQAVAQILSSVSPEVVSRPEPARQVDVSVIIGNDYQIPDKRWRL